MNEIFVIFNRGLMCLEGCFKNADNMMLYLDNQVKLGNIKYFDTTSFLSLINTKGFYVTSSLAPFYVKCNI